MLKRKSSPAPSTRVKWLKTASGSRGLPDVESRLDTALYDELILVIFAHLSWADLCVAQAVSKNWARLALDNQLWRALYIREYGRGRLRGGKGFGSRSNCKEVKSLHYQAKLDECKDWKSMFRISLNWRSGRCTVEQLKEPNSVLRLASDTLRVSEDLPHQTHILLTGTISVMAPSIPSLSPIIDLHYPDRQTITLQNPSPSHSSMRVQITALALDQSPPLSTHQIRLISFLSTGEFTSFSIDQTIPSPPTCDLIYIPLSRTDRAAPIIQAVYHHPLLITLSKWLYLSFFDLSGDTVTHTQTLTSFSSFPPTSLVLSVLSTTTYKLVLAYGVPVYPAYWSVGATELVISAATMTVQSTRTIHTFDPPHGWIDERRYKAMREQWGRKVTKIADTRTDGKWLVLAPEDTLASISSSLHQGSNSSAPPASSLVHSPHSSASLQLYRLLLPKPLRPFSGGGDGNTSGSFSPQMATPPLAQAKLTFVRHLHGQIGSVSALSVADGRCVSLGQNGSIWVWDLEAGTGTEVSGGASRHADGAANPSEEKEAYKFYYEKGTVAFDDRRIVSALPGAGGIQLRSFDI